MKQHWKAGNMVYPVPAALISCGSSPETYNIFTVSWVGTLCTNPALCYISVRPERHSHSLIQDSGCFVINLTNEALSEATDWCGVRSGRDHKKFEACGLTPAQSRYISAPIIWEAPISIECRVKSVQNLGSHDMFTAEVVNIQADERYIDPESGRFMMEQAKLIAYSHGHYYSLGQQIGKFGWSVEKKRKKNRTFATPKNKHS